MQSVVPLDCDTFETALQSVSAILNIPGDELLNRLRDFDYEAIPENEKRQHDYEPRLIAYSTGRADHELPTPAIVHWFHATRVAPHSDFKEGILPVPMMKERLWTGLGELASEWVTAEDWAEFRQNIGGAYRLKMRWDGPFAFVCRDIIFRWEKCHHHDYLGVPEIVEDICNSFTDKFGYPLMDKFVDATKPCIVKFRSSKPRPDAVGKALMYIHLLAQPGNDRIGGCVTCIDNGGEPIKRSDILRIDWPNIDNSRFDLRISGEDGGT